MTAPQRPDVRPGVGRARLDSLTALRFFAASTVVLYHSWGALTGSLDVGLLHYGYTAVGFFFTLSGLVLGWSWRSTTGARLHWRRRAARILPLHWLLLTTVVVIYVVWPATRPVADTRTALVVQAGLLQAWPPFTNLLTFNYPSWSLSTEAFFYLVFPLVMVCFARLRATSLVRVGIALVAVYVAAALVLHHLAIPTLTDGNLLALPPLQLAKFAAGAAFGAALAGGWRPRVPAWVATLLLAAVVVALPVATTTATSWGWILPAGPLFADLLLAAPMVLLVVAVAGSDLARWSSAGTTGALGRSRLLVSLGESSFALYLVHVPMLQLTYVVSVARPDLPLRGPAALVGFMAACLLLASLLHRYVEKPVEQWVRRREPRPAQVTTTTSTTATAACRQSAGTGSRTDSAIPRRVAPPTHPHLLPAHLG